MNNICILFFFKKTKKVLILNLKKNHIKMKFCILACLILSLSICVQALHLTQAALREYAGMHSKEPEYELSSLQINLIDANAFDPISKTLIILDLSFNNLTKIQPAVFAKLSKLKSLDLGHNNLGSIDPNLFGGLKNLENLELEKCELNSLDPFIFKHLTKLMQLDLSKTFT